MTNFLKARALDGCRLRTNCSWTAIFFESDFPERSQVLIHQFVVNGTGLPCNSGTNIRSIARKQDSDYAPATEHTPPRHGLPIKRCALRIRHLSPATPNVP